jgi:hypothetical protein
MARKFGKTYKMSEKFEDYSYIINGVGGIGKTTLVYEIGKLVTGSNEGTFIITCGGENKPKHIPDAFGDVAPDFKTFKAIVKELCDNKAEYPHTKFVAIDSLDEYARIVEDYVVAEWNASCEINERAKSIKQAYKGFQGGENRATNLMIQQVLKLQEAGYSLLEIGHTKTKTKEDVTTKIQFEQLTCNLDNKYYNALKDKVNLVAMCYFEHVIDNVEEKKNAFTKKMNKVGELVDRKRVMVFADDDNAIDCKSHFEYIAHKIDFDAEGFVKAVEDAIAMKLAAVSGGTVEKPVAQKETKPIPAPVVEEHIDDDDEATAPFDMDDDLDDVAEIEFDADAAKVEIRNLHKKANAEQKAKIKELRNGMKLDDIDDEDILTEMLKALR